MRTRPSFLLSQSLPSGSFHRPLILLHQRADRLKTTVTKKLTNLISWTTALTNSVKLWAMPCGAIQDRQVMVESSNKMCSTAEGDGKPLQYCCLENPMNSVKSQKDRTLKDQLHRLIGTQYATGEITPERMKRCSQSKNNTQLWMWLVMETRSEDIKSNVA